MPSYAFTILNDVGLLPAGEGIVLADDEAARAYAIEIVAHIIGGELRIDRPSVAMTMSVQDESAGREILRFRAFATVEGPPANALTH